MAQAIVTPKVTSVEYQTIVDALELYRVHMFNLGRDESVEKIAPRIEVVGGDPRRCGLRAAEIIKNFGLVR